MGEMRRALILGASRGLGLGLASELKSRGWDVVATVRGPAGASRLQAVAAKPGGKLTVEKVDITDLEGVKALRRRMEGQTLDLLFVVAGISGPHPQDTLRTGPEQISKLFLTNAIAPIRCARMFLDLVRDGPGVVALMSSHAASLTRAKDGTIEIYRASKAALNSLTRSLTFKLGEKRVTVLLMAPGWVRTDMGGPKAAQSVEESVRGMVDVIEQRAGSFRHAYVDYRGVELAW